MEVIKPYSRTDSHPTITSYTEKKRRKDREVCTPFFCPETGCSGSFEKNSELEEHILSGQHGASKEKSSLDAVQNVFVSKMKALSDIHSCSSSSIVQTTSCTVNNQFSSIFQKIGWALPTRSTFRYSKKQKQILYAYFTDGEKNGKKMSPEEVHLLLRKKLSPKEYVTTQQIRSLFSHWSMLY